MTRKEKIEKLMTYFSIGSSFLNGGQAPPIEDCVELEKQFKKLTDEEFNRYYDQLVKSN